MPVSVTAAGGSTGVGSVGPESSPPHAAATNAMQKMKRKWELLLRGMNCPDSFPTNGPAPSGAGHTVPRAEQRATES